MAVLTGEDRPFLIRIREFNDVARTLRIKGFLSDHLVINCGGHKPYSDCHPGKIRRKHLENSSLTHQQTLVETNAPCGEGRGGGGVGPV